MADHFVLILFHLIIFRLAVRMVGRESYSCEVLHSAIMLLLLKPSVGQKNSTSICYGLFELIRASIGSDISFENWRIIFALLEMAGAGTKPPTVVVRVVEPVTESETTLVEESTAAAEPAEETEQDTTAAEEVVAGGEEADSGKTLTATNLGIVPLVSFIFSPCQPVSRFDFKKLKYHEAMNIMRP